MQFTGLENVQQIDQYILKKEISRGGMGVVYLAEDTQLHRPTALKVILKQSEYSRTIGIKRFRREMEVMGKLHHPYVIQIYTAGVFQNNPYIAMEYVDGVPLLEYTQQLPENDFISIATLIQKILQAFSYIHSKQIIHRDVKSTNILVRPNGDPVVLDFGISKAKDVKTLTATGTIIGSLNMAPEQAKGLTRNLNQQSDIYSIGTLLYEILTKQPVVQANSFMELLQKIISEDPILPSQWNPSIPPMLEYITLKSLEKKQQKRYATASLMEKDLKKFLQNKDQQKPSLYLYKKQYKKHFQKIIILSLCLVLILLGYLHFPSFQKKQKKTVDVSMIISWETTLSQLQLQCSMHINHIQEKCHDPSVYTDLFKNMTETTQYKNIKNNGRYLHNLEQRLQQTPWDATLYKESTFLLTEMAKMHFENHQEEKAKKYQKQAEEKLRKYFTIQPYNKKIFTKFAEPYMYIIGNSTLKEDLHISQKFINTSILSWGNIEWSDLFPYTDICTTYLQKEKSTWNKDKFDIYKKMFQNKDNNILLQKILTSLVLTPEFCKLYQEDKEIRELFQQEREQAIQNHDILKPIKQLLAQYYLTRDSSYLSYIFTYTHKYIPTLHHILDQDEEYFFRFLAAYVLSICKEKEAENALEKTMENWIDNLDSALLSYICAKKMDLQMKYPNFLNVVPTEIADTTKLIFLQYILDILDKDKTGDSMQKYIQKYMQDENLNIVLLSMYFMLKTIDQKYQSELKISFQELQKEYGKNIQQIWRTIKTQDKKHILIFFNIANKFSNVIKSIHAMGKNIIKDIQTILEQTQNPDIQENALKFLQHYSANEYENISKTWLKKEYLEENVKLFLISSIENQQIDFEYILKSKDISLYSKMLLLHAIFKTKDKSVFQLFIQDKNIELILGTINDLLKDINKIEDLILEQDIDNRAKPFYIYCLAMYPNVSPIYNVKIKLLDSPNEVVQKAILLSLGSYPYLGHYYNAGISILNPKKKQRKKEAIKKKQSTTNNQAMFQEEIQQMLHTVSETIQPYATYAYVMMESFEEMNALPKLTCFTTKEQKWGALYGYEKILYYDFPELPIQWNLQKKYEMFLQQLYMILQQSIGTTHEDCKLYPKEFHFFSIPPTPKHLQNFIDALTYSIQIALEIADIAPEIAGSMNSIYDSILLQRYLERAIVYLVASQKYRDEEKADYALKALNDIEFVIQHDKTTRILQKYYALILYNALQYKNIYKEENIIDEENKINKAKVQEQLEYAKMLYPWDEDIIQAYNNIVQNKDISSEYKYKDIDWIFPQY